MRRGHIAGDATASEMGVPEAFMARPECELYMVNPFTGWAAQHILLPEEKVEERFIPLETTDRENRGRIVKVQVCGGCAQLLDRDYGAVKPGTKEQP